MKLIHLLILTLAFVCCGGSSSAEINEKGNAVNDSLPDNPIVLTTDYEKDKSFIVISKKDQKLQVYADVNGDTVLLASFPVCLSLNKGQKEKSGDMKTPESEPGKPFRIKQIQDASTWEHDFGDGRGIIKAYGNWFLRLETPFNGIGIHGSTNNEETVPGRASEGCIRLKDKDIIILKEKYAYVGMPVIIKTEDQGDLPFEKKQMISNQ